MSKSIKLSNEIVDILKKQGFYCPGPGKIFR